MKTTICAKIRTTDLHTIDEFCLKNNTNRSKWALLAISKQAKADGLKGFSKYIEKGPEPERKIKSKIEKK